MFELDRQGVPHMLNALDARPALGLLSDSVLDMRTVDRKRLRVILRLVETHLDSTVDASRWKRLVAGRERMEADTTPEVTSSIEASIGTALGTNSQGVDQWIADVLDIRFRLPQLHARLEKLEADLWKVRQVARLTHNLPFRVAAFIDTMLAELIDKIGMAGIQKAVALAIAQLLPERLEEHDHAGRSGWHVAVHHPAPVDFDGTSVLEATADSLDLDDFMSAVGQIAEELGRAGDTDPLPLRMAKALGVLGRRTISPPGDDVPAAADAAGDVADDESAGDESASDESASDESASDESSGTAPRRGKGAQARRAPKGLNIFVRAADGSEDQQPRLFGVVPRWGVVSQAVLDRWMASHRARFTSVVDLDRGGCVDQHDPPARMRLVVMLRDRHCVFPGCTRAAENCDVDHITPYDPHGPPGQTSPEKLACLCRRHHLLKTHAGWSYHRDERGSYVWTSPHGFVYVVDEDGTDHLVGQVA